MKFFHDTQEMKFLFVCLLFVWELVLSTSWVLEIKLRCQAWWQVPLLAEAFSWHHFLK